MVTDYTLNDVLPIIQPNLGLAAMIFGLTVDGLRCGLKVVGWKEMEDRRTAIFGERKKPVKLFKSRKEQFEMVDARIGRRPRTGPWAICTPNLRMRERLTYSSYEFAYQRLLKTQREGKDRVLAVWREHRWQNAAKLAAHAALTAMEEK